MPPPDRFPSVQILQKKTVKKKTNEVICNMSNLNKTNGTSEGPHL